MLETYLFITPWGDECFKCEKETIRYFGRAEEKVDLKIFPVLNMQVVLNYMKHNQVKNGNYNDLFNRMYLTCLDYKAACYQGRAKGRQFLVAMQKAVIDKGESYSIELGSQLAQQVGLDLTMFEDDRRSEMVQKEFKHDQQLAHEMGAESIPAAAIFNVKDEEYGILMDHYDYQTLASVCKLKLASDDDNSFIPETL